MFQIQEQFNPDVPHTFDASNYTDLGSMKDLFGIPLWQGDSFWQLRAHSRGKGHPLTS